MLSCLGTQNDKDGDNVNGRFETTFWVINYSIMQMMAVRFVKSGHTQGIDEGECM